MTLCSEALKHFPYIILHFSFFIWFPLFVRPDFWVLLAVGQDNYDRDSLVVS